MSIVSTTGTIREEIAYRLNEAESDNTDFYNNAINLGLQDIENTFPKAPFLQLSADRTLSSGTRIYANMPTDLSKLNGVIYPAGDVKLTYLSPEEFDALQPSATEGGTPTIYTLRGAGSSAEINFYPVPNSNLTVHYDYQKAVGSVSLASAIPGIPLKYFELLCLFGEYRGLARRGLRVEAREVREEYESMKEKMIEDLMSRTTENGRIRSSREFGRVGQTLNDPIRNIFGNF